MFNLDQAITAWRQQMAAGGIKAPEILNELESHLRDDMEQQIQSGLDAQQAFENSVQRLGHADKLNNEFKKTCGANRYAWRWFGSFGLVGTTLLNLVGLFVFHRSSSVFFSHQWWSDWFPNYIVWISFTIIGMAIGFTNWNSQRKATRPPGSGMKRAR
jgi:hypothetical protein